MKLLIIFLNIVWVCFFTNVTLFAQNLIIQEIVNKVELDTLIDFTEKLSGEKSVIINQNTYTIHSRQHQKVGNELAYQFLKQEFKRFGYEIDSLRFSPTGKNLFAIKYGSLFPDRWVMLGAHYDNLPLAINSPGADDNASGCAAVLEAGRIFKDYQFPYTIVFTLWDEEEPGLIGSSAYISRIGSKQEQLIGYINLDMIAWDGNNDSIVDVNVLPIGNSEILKDKVLLCNQTYQIGLYPNVVYSEFYNSDHIPFWEGGYTAIAINENALNDLNPHIHKVTDKIEHFNFSFFKRCTQLALATLADIALDTIQDYGFYSDENKIICYPNPFINQLIIKMNVNEIIQNVRFYNLTGELLQNIQGNSSKVVVSDLGLASGVYFVSIETNQQKYTVKLCKQ